MFLLHSPKGWKQALSLTTIQQFHAIHSQPFAYGLVGRRAVPMEIQGVPCVRLYICFQGLGRGESRCNPSNAKITSAS
jgi:hypothetical protein